MNLNNSNPADIARAMVEGMLCGLVDAVDALEKLGVNVKRIILIGGAAKNPAVAQIAAAPQQSAMVPFSLTPERKGQNIVIIDQPRQQQNIITPTASGGGPTPSPISDFDLLNNFIKNKLLLDLAYL
jgi:hypothetical protein